MSLDLALNPRTHDLDLDASGRASFIAGVARVRQQVEIALRTWLGEWFLDTTFGVPYLQQLRGKAPRAAAVDALIRAKVQEVDDVRRVTRIDIRIDRANRTMRIDLEVDSAVGPVRVTFAPQG